MEDWLYQMTNGSDWGVGEYRVQVWEGRIIDWPAGKITGRNGAKPQKGDKGEKPAKGEAPPDKAPKAKKPEQRVTPRLKTHFEQVVRKQLTEQFSYSSRMQVPMIDKVVINMGIGEGVADRKKVESAATDLGLISGQKAVITKARKSIATFKVRDGQAIGCKVTLRKKRMYEFVDRLINIALPRVRDFRGLPNNCFEGRGNLTVVPGSHTTNWLPGPPRRDLPWPAPEGAIQIDNVEEGRPLIEVCDLVVESQHGRVQL